MFSGEMLIVDFVGNPGNVYLLSLSPLFLPDQHFGQGTAYERET